MTNNAETVFAKFNRDLAVNVAWNLLLQADTQKGRFIICGECRKRQVKRRMRRHRWLEDGRVQFYVQCHKCGDESHVAYMDEPMLKLLVLASNPLIRGKDRAEISRLNGQFQQRSAQLNPELGRELTRQRMREAKVGV